MKYISTWVLVVLLAFTANAQDKNAVKYAKTITKKDLKARLSVLAADSLEGRNTGEIGQKKAAKYIQEQIQAMGLEPVVPTPDGTSYMQSYPLKKSSYRAGYMKRGNEVKTNFEDYLYYSRQETMGEEFIDVVFVGTRSIEELKKMDLKGKYLAFVSTDASNWRTTMSDLRGLESSGAIVIYEDQSRVDFLLARYVPRLNKDRLSLELNNSTNKIIVGNPALASWIFDTEYEKLKAEGEGKVARIVLNSDLLIEDITAENVMGFIEGSEKPEEVLVISAHYDHVGVNEDGSINNGADDDGSGSTTVLELAEAFSLAAKKGLKPKRSILFLWVSGEEKGLLGSEYYTDNPVFPIANTVTNLNVDMVGRTDPGHEGKDSYVYVIGADKLSQELHDLSEEVNKTYTKIDLDYTYNDENDPNRYYYRSDHYNFAEKGVPIIFYFNGTHADYHKPTDTIEKIEFDQMRERALLVYYTAWELANRENRVKLK